MSVSSKGTYHSVTAQSFESCLWSRLENNLVILPEEVQHVGRQLAGITVNLNW